MSQTSAVQRFFGASSLGCGIVIAGLSGLCSLLVMTEPGRLNEDDLVMIGVIGGIPFLVGIGLFFLGRHLLREPQAPKQDIDSFE